MPGLHRHQSTGMVKGLSVVLIGATSGIGEATARLLAAEGAELVFAGRRSDKGRALAALLGPTAVFQRADVTVEPDVQALIGAALERHGRVDGVINCAGESLPGSAMEQIDIEQAQRLIADAVGAALAVTKHAALAMLPQRSGSIVHLASIAGHSGGWSGVAYSAAKAAVLQVTRSAAVELGERGIRVNSISPGPILTGMFAKAVGVDPNDADLMTVRDEDFMEAVSPWQAIPRVGRPIDVAGTAVWLISDQASLLNGVDIPIDGGISAGRPASIGMPARSRLASAFKAPDEHAASPRGELGSQGPVAR